MGDRRRRPVETVQSLHAQFVFDGWVPEPDFERAWRLQERRPADSRLRYAESGRLGALLRRARERVPISPSLRAELQAWFREDVALLSSELGRDLFHWLR